jgi:adenylate cyclase
VNASSRWTARTLFDALDRRGATRAEQDAFDVEVWSRFGVEGTILVTDLSGFTRTTRTRGILHFLTIFRRSEVLADPIVAAHGGRVLKHEADDLIVEFGSPRRAVEAALELQRRFRALNATLAEDERVGLCVGIEHGRYIGLADDAFGDPVNVAYKLGEDVAEVGEVLVGDAALSAARAEGFALDAAVVLDGPRRRALGGLEIVHHSLRLAPEPRGAQGGTR